MRVAVLAFALIAFAQPAFAGSHRHSHHGAHAYHHHRFAYVRRMPADPAPVVFARTDAIDTPFLGNPSSPDRSWTANPWNQTQAPARAQRFAAVPRAIARDHGALDAMIARHAAANGVPAELVHRVVTRESRYNPLARNRGNLGLMQIRYATARGVGYAGSAAGLLDPETNLTYAIRYLAGAYRAAGGNASRAVAYYASGYHGRGLQYRQL